MAISHDSYCDENHQPRQRCNQALAPTPDALNTLAPAPEADPAPIPEPPAAERIDQPVAEPPPSASVREAVIAGAMPAASPYATRAWEDTTRALDAAPQDDDMPSTSEATEPSGPNVPLMLGAALIVIMLIVLRLRSRQRSDLTHADHPDIG